MISIPKPLVFQVDDDPDIVRLVDRFLTSDGCVVVSADSGMTALRMLDRVKPDVILLDINLPEMDGYQICSHLQQNEATAFVPVIFVTGSDAEQDKARAFAAGAADYLVKPVRKDTLTAAVRRHLDTRATWYNVQLATELWDETPLPEKFRQFRASLAGRMRLEGDAARELEQLKSSEVYRYTEFINLSEEELAEHMARFFGVDYLPELEAESLQLGILPSSFCRSHHVVAIRDAQGQDAYVISNPFQWDLDSLDTLERAFKGRPYRLVVAARKTIDSLFFDESGGGEKKSSAATPSTFSDVDVHAQQEVPIDKLPVSEDRILPAQAVHSVIADAVRKGASDIHIEPEKTRIRVRYRIDGRMRYIVPLQSSLISGIAGRIKVMCNMDLAENRKPQDGNCLVRVDGQEIELRVSTLPANQGESIVLRILNKTAGLYQLDALGYEPEMLRRLLGLLSARQGMILITGPTGSGKTTSLYAALNHLNNEETKIITVEDPVEVDVEGITQVQIHDRAGRSFASALRAILRQDPDVIMVGEIRDTETAEIAARAALTGHVVLSTLHTQDALGSVTRLRDMGIPGYLVASALNGALAQRLVRRVCDACSADYMPPRELLHALQRQFGSVDGARFRKGQGCARCQRSGTRGRVGVFELLIVDEDLRRLLSDNAPPSAMAAHLKTQGFKSMEQDAFRKACAGIIPPEEILHLGLGLAMSMGD